MYQSLLPTNTPSPTIESSHAHILRHGLGTQGDHFTVGGNLIQSGLTFYFNSCWVNALIRSFDVYNAAVINGVTMPFSWMSLSVVLATAGVTSICDYIINSTQDGQNEHGQLAAKNSKTRLTPTRTALLAGTYSASTLATAGALADVGTTACNLISPNLIENDESGLYRGLLLLGTFAGGLYGSWSRYRANRNSQIAAQEMDNYVAELNNGTHLMYGSL